jgi:transcriptional regulator with XRE-family HTH domain
MQISATDAIVGRRLRIFRVSKGYDVSALAAALKLDAETIERYENGAEHIPPGMLRNAAGVLEISLHAFFDPHHAKIVHGAAAPEVGPETERPSNASETAELLAHFTKIRDPDLRSEILKFLAFLSSTP